MQPGDAQYPSLRDRVVFVTGGGSGIGESIVSRLAAMSAVGMRSSFPSPSATTSTPPSTRSISPVTVFSSVVTMTRARNA